MKRLVTLSIPLLLFFMLISCGGITDVGEENDPTIPMGDDSSTYMRTSSDGNTSTVEMVTIEDPDADNRGEIALFQMDDTDNDPQTDIKTVLIVRATYQIAGVKITVYPYFRYENDYQAKDPQGSAGATREEYAEGTSVQYDFTPDGGGGTIKLDNFTFTRVDGIYDNIMAEAVTYTRAVQMMRMYELTIMFSQTKIEGFGGLGMSNYLDKTSRFKGTRIGTFDLSPETRWENLEMWVKTHFDYETYSDFSSMTLNGRQTSDAKRNGNGTMWGTVDITVSGTANTWPGSVKYDALVITATVASSGYYEVTLDDGVPVTENVDYATTNPGNFTFTDILAEDTQAGKLSLPDVS